jgi:uncharacterized protein
VSNKLPSREQATEILQKHHCSAKVIEHCQAVASLALDLSKQLEAKNYKVNFELVKAGALLHDLGRSQTHSVNHGVVGAKLAEAEGLPAEVVYIIKRHVGAGITNQEAENFGWPKDNYIPTTLEEKIVCYADKLVDGSKIAPIGLTIEQLKREQKNDAAERVRNLHNEIMSLLGNRT